MERVLTKGESPHLRMPQETLFSNTMEAKNEEGEAPLRHSSDVAAPRPRRPTPDHPPYAEMVRVALRELAEEGGSSEASISCYIQSNYTQLPPGHSRLLPYYLGKFVAAGDVSMLSPNRFALPPAPPPPLPILPHHYPILNPNHHPNPNPLRSSFRQKTAVPQIPRRRRRPPKRKKAATSGSAVGGLMLPPWPTTPHHVTDSSASAPPPPPLPCRGRGRPRKYPATKAPSPTEPASVGEPVPRPRLIIRLRSKPPNPMPGTVAAAASEMTTVQVMGKCNLRDGLASECDARNVYGSEASRRKPDEKSLPANAYIDEESSLLPTVQSEPETDEALLPLVSLDSEPDVEMLHMDQMQPEPEGGLLLLLQPELDFSRRAQSLPTSVKPETKKDQSLPPTMRPKSTEESSPPAIQANVESLLSAGVHLEPEPSEEPLASAQLHIETKELKEEPLSSSSSSSIQPKSDESILPQVLAYSEPCKELLLLDPMQPKLEEELLQLLPLQSSELHEEPMLSISPQPGPEEQLLLPAPSRMELIEISSQLAPEQPESIEETLLQLELDEEYLPPAQLLSEPKEEPLLLPSIQIEPKEELLSLASIEPEVKEESSPPAPIPAAEKRGHSSKHRRTHVKHRRLWFEC